LVRLSDGSPGQAMALSDAALWEFRRKLLAGLFQPGADRGALGQGGLNFVGEAGKEAAFQRQGAGPGVRPVLQFLRDALRVKVGGTPKLGDAEDLRLLQMLADRADPENLLDLLERSLEADVQLDRRVQLVLVMDALLDGLGQLQAR